MPIRESHQPGTPSWVDYESSDIEAAKAFYGALFGWDFFEAPEPEAGGYTMALLNGNAAAALMPQPAERQAMGIPAHWNTYITVADIDATAAAIRDAGGSVMAEPFDVLTAGRMMVAVDRAGAVVCFWEPRDAIGCEVVNETGAFTWAELYGADPADAAAFYVDLFGLNVVTEEMAGTAMHFLQQGDQGVASVLPFMADGMPPHWMPYFGVDDCDAAMATITELGGSVSMGPMDIEPGRFAVCCDPEGAVFAVIAPAGAQ